MSFRMSLFPAYAKDTESNSTDEIQTPIPITTFELEASYSPAEAEDGVVAAEAEAGLLASDSDDGDPPPPLPPNISTTEHNDFYIDKKLDRGNLRVSTLYYPGRPEYHKPSKRSSTAATSGAEKLRRRYYEMNMHELNRDNRQAEEVSLKVQQMQKALLSHPHDVDLWLQLIDFQERWCGAASALASATAALARFPPAPATSHTTPSTPSTPTSHSVLATRRRRLARLALPHHQYVDLLNQEIQLGRGAGVCGAGGCGAGGAGGCCVTAALCERVVAAGRGGADAARAAAVAAANTTDHRQYVQVIYFYGHFLSAAGLSEQLVQLVELLAGLNLRPPAAPPAHHVHEDKLTAYEDQTTRSGLPLWAVWWRVERARAHAHWRPAHEGAADPQRSPRAADAADLLRPVTDPAALFLLHIHMLSCIGVPVLSGGVECSVLTALHGEQLADAAAAAAASTAAAALPLLQRLYSRHAPAPPAPAAAAARLLAALADPPHYFTDEHGYLSWVLWVWRCSGEGGGVAAAWRPALALAQLRWLHSLILLTDDPAERSRLRAVARECVPPSAATPLLAAQAALLRGAGGAGGEGGGEAAARGAARALAVAISDPDTPHAHVLYIARLVCECVGPGSALGRTALAAAAARRLPPPPHTLPPPPHTPAQHPHPQLVRDAIAQCVLHCERLQAGAGAGAVGEVRAAPWLALLPAEDEWVYAAAHLTHTPLHYQFGGLDWVSARCRERGAELAAARGDFTHAHLYTHNCSINIALSEWGRWRRPPPPPPPVQSPTRALAAALPALLRAYSGDHQHTHTQLGMAARILSRATGGESGALAWAARGEAARGAGLPAALTHYPHHKWLYGRAVTWMGAGAAGAGAAGAGDAWEDLIDVILEKQLRLHALPQELLPL